VPKIVESQAFAPLNKTLGIGGSGDSETELLDGELVQTMEMGAIARRGRTIAGTEGLFRCVMRTVHTAAEVLTTSWQPYQPGATGTIAPYPNPVPDGFDVWLLGCSVERVSGNASISEAALRLTQVQQGFGIDDSAAAVVSTSVFTIAFWNSLELGIEPAYGVISSRGWPWKPVKIRIPRKGAIASPFLVFGAESGGTLTVDCVMLIGIFPSALGQDGIG